MICEKIHIPPSPTHCVQFFSSRAYEFFRVDLEVSTKDESARARLVEFAREGLDLRFNQRNNEIRRFFFVLFYNKQ